MRMSLWDGRKALLFAIEGGVEEPSSEVGSAIRNGHGELRKRRG